MAADYTSWNGNLFQVNRKKETVCVFTLESAHWKRVHQSHHDHRHLGKVVTSLDVDSDVILPHLIKLVEKDHTFYYVILQWNGNDFTNQMLLKECPHVFPYNITSLLYQLNSLTLFTSKHVIDDDSLKSSTHWCCPWLPITPTHYCNLLITHQTGLLSYSLVSLNDDNSLTSSSSLISRFIPPDYTDILKGVVIHWYYKVEGGGASIKPHPLFIIYTSMGQVLLLEEGVVKCCIHSNNKTSSSIINVIIIKTPDGQMGIVVHQSDLTVTAYKISTSVLDKGVGLTPPPSKWHLWSGVHHILSGDFMRKGTDQILLIFEKETLHNFLVTDLVNDLLKSSDSPSAFNFENGMVAMETDAPPTSLLATSRALRLRQIKDNLIVERKKVEKQLKEELYGKSLHVLENMCRGIDTGITEDKRLFTLISSDDVSIAKTNQIPPTSYQMTTPLQLQDSWQRCVDESIATVLIITNKGQQCLSDVSLWLQSCDLSPFHSRFTFTAKGFLTPNKGCSHNKEDVASLCLEKNETICVVMTTKVLTHRSKIQAVVMATWMCHGKRECAEVTIVTLGTERVIMSNISSLQWIDTSDITLSDQDKWKELTSIVGSRCMTTLKTNWVSQLFSLLKEGSSPLLVTIDDYLIQGIGPLEGVVMFFKETSFVQVLYREGYQLQLLSNVFEQSLPDATKVSFDEMN